MSAHCYALYIAERTPQKGVTCASGASSSTAWCEMIRIALFYTRVSKSKQLSCNQRATAMPIGAPFSGLQLNHSEGLPSFPKKQKWATDEAALRLGNSHHPAGKDYRQIRRRA